MNFRNTVAVAVLFLALGGYLYFVESEKIQRESEKDALLSLEIDDVDGVTLRYPREDTRIVLRKTGAGWHLQEPLDTAADQSAADNLVRAIADAEVTRTLEGDLEGLGTYGLDEPETIVAVTRTNGENIPEIRIGKSTPVGYSAFVQLAGESSVKLVSSAFSTGMKKEVKDLRDKTIIDFAEDEVQRIHIDSSDVGTIELARKDASWTIEKPEPAPADEGEVRAFLSSLRSMRAQDFIDLPESLEELGLATPRRRIAVVGKDETRKEILIGAEKEIDEKKELYVKRSDRDTVYTIGSYAWTQLSKTAANFRDKTVLAFSEDDLGSIEVLRADGESFRLERVPRTDAPPTPRPTPTTEAGETGWQVAGATGSRASAVTQLVGDIRGLKGYEIAAEKPADLSPFGLATPALTFSVLNRSGEPLGRILVSQAEGDGGEKRIYAMAEGTAIVFRIRDYLYTHLDKKRADLVEAEPAASDAGVTQTPAE